MSSSDLLAGRYRLTRQLGQGSFAETYLAEDTTLNRPVAIKILRSQYAQDERFALRFEREARAAAAVRHGNIVDVFDYGQDGQTLYLVMEWVDGPNLKEFLRGRGMLSPEESAGIMRDVLQGIQAIHRAGIVHRDIKPQNVLIDQGGVAKLSDFGIARGELDAGLTDTGMALGTAAYMAPEQARAGEVGPPADLYAAGVLLFEMLTGRLPFPGENPLQVMYQHVNEAPPDPRQFNASLPSGLALVILKALAKEPSDRFQSAQEMLAAIEHPPAGEEETRIMSAATPDRTRVMPGSPPRRAGRAAPPRRTRRRQGTPIWPVALVTGLLILFAAGGLIYLATRDTEPVADVTPTPTIEPTPELTPTPEPDPTPTPEPEPTPTPEPDPTPTPEPEPTPTPEPEPTPTPEPEPTPTPDVGEVEDPGVGTQANAVTFTVQTIGASTRELFGSIFEGAWFPDAAGGEPAAASYWYSQATDYSTGEAEFVANSASGTNVIGIEMRAMNDEFSGSVPIRISINDTVVFRGDSPFPEGSFGTVRWTYREREGIREGVNIVTIENLAEEGAFGEPPWLLVHTMTIYYR